MSPRSAHIPTNRRAVTDLRAPPALTLCFLATCFMCAILRPCPFLRASSGPRSASTPENPPIPPVDSFARRPLGISPHPNAVYQPPVRVATRNTGRYQVRQVAPASTPLCLANITSMRPTIFHHLILRIPYLHGRVWPRRLPRLRRHADEASRREVSCPASHLLCNLSFLATSRIPSTPATPASTPGRCSRPRRRRRSLAAGSPAGGCGAGAPEQRRGHGAPSGQRPPALLF
jgi:hypothetical protein